MRYPIAIELGTDQHAYGVVVPDVPGAFSAGDTLEEAIANAEDAILLALEDAGTAAEPTPLKDLVGKGRFAGWAWAIANVDLSKLSGKAVRVNITLPDRLLHSIDTYANAHGETRSGFLARAAMDAMAE
ncbi:MAG: type II toxin-antitoxin system HicB family antitoxin [Rhodanobacteraceae bacterium]